MIQIPTDLAKLYTSFMEQKGVETDQHLYLFFYLRLPSSIMHSIQPKAYLTGVAPEDGTGIICGFS